MALELNLRARQIADQIAGSLETLRGELVTVAGARIIDLGIKAEGGLQAGLRLAECCLAGLGTVQLVPAPVFGGPAVQVATDQPVAACMASQYAGWQIAKGKYFAMGSGPMRAIAAKEELFTRIGHQETAPCAVGVLETRKYPTDEVIAYLCEACHVPPAELTLLAAPTASQAGTVQVVARSVETALHKLFELGFDLRRVQSGYGVAPLPPVAPDDLAGIGRTNDAILYGGDVALWVRGDDDSLADVVSRVPSSASRDYGAPFSEIFERSGRDFYKIDPHLFSPARVTLINMDTGRSFSAGAMAPEIVQRSFQS